VGGEGEIVGSKRGDPEFRWGKSEANQGGDLGRPKKNEEKVQNPPAKKKEKKKAVHEKKKGEKGNSTQKEESKVGEQPTFRSNRKDRKTGVSKALFQSGRGKKDSKGKKASL